ncbi:GNAT family N-acetyltransferase [Endothiovibrio diazotrophicus]
MSIEISPADADEIPQLCDLLDLLFTQEAEFRPDRAVQARGLRRIIEAPAVGRILVAREEGRVVGMVNLLFTVSTALGAPVGLLEDMVVHPERRGGGIGSRLLEAAVELAEGAGCGRITLLTDRSNEAAQRYYRRHGFERSAMIPMRRVLDGRGNA